MIIPAPGLGHTLGPRDLRKGHLRHLSLLALKDPTKIQPEAKHESIHGLLPSKEILDLNNNLSLKELQVQTDLTVDLLNQVMN